MLNPRITTTFENREDVGREVAEAGSSVGGRADASLHTEKSA